MERGKKKAKIEFKKPGHGTLRACFHLGMGEIERIKSTTDEQGKYIFDKSVDVVSESTELMASVIKTLYVRNKSWQSEGPLLP